MPLAESIQISTGRALGGSASSNVGVCLGRELSLGLLLEQLEVGCLWGSTAQSAHVDLSKVSGLQ